MTVHEEGKWGKKMGGKKKPAKKRKEKKEEKKRSNFPSEPWPYSSHPKNPGRFSKCVGALANPYHHCAKCQSEQAKKKKSAKVNFLQHLRKPTPLWMPAGGLALKLVQRRGGGPGKTTTLPS